MRTTLLQRAVFIGKSLLWSLLFYFLTVVILDWNEVKTVLNGSRPDTDNIAAGSCKRLPEKTKASANLKRKNTYLRYMQAGAIILFSAKDRGLLGNYTATE